MRTGLVTITKIMIMDKSVHCNHLYFASFLLVALNVLSLCYRGGGRGGYGGGDRRRDYRDGGGPDRHSHGGGRARPY